MLKLSVQAPYIQRLVVVKPENDHLKAVERKVNVTRKKEIILCINSSSSIVIRLSDNQFVYAVLGKRQVLAKVKKTSSEKE